MRADCRKGIRVAYQCLCCFPKPTVPVCADNNRELEDKQSPDVRQHSNQYECKNVDAILGICAFLSSAVIPCVSITVA